MKLSFDLLFLLRSFPMIELLKVPLHWPFYSLTHVLRYRSPLFGPRCDSHKTRPDCNALDMAFRCCWIKFVLLAPFREKLSGRHSSRWCWWKDGKCRRSVDEWRKEWFLMAPKAFGKVSAHWRIRRVLGECSSPQKRWNCPSLMSVHRQTRSAVLLATG